MTSASKLWLEGFSQFVKGTVTQLRAIVLLLLPHHTETRVREIPFIPNNIMSYGILFIPFSWGICPTSADMKGIPSDPQTKSRGGHRDAQRAGAPLLGRQAERAGAVQPGEEKAPESSKRLCRCLKRVQESWRGTGDESVEWQDTGNGFKLKKGRFD